MRRGGYNSFPQAAELKGLVVKAMTELGRGRARRPDLHPKNSSSRKLSEKAKAH